MIYDEEDLLSKVNAKVTKAVSWTGSLIKDERRRVLDYYEGRLPSQRSKGNSSYVSNDVYDAVETMKAQLLDTFGGVRNVVRFKPKTPQDAEMARGITKYMDHAFYEVNDGYNIVADVSEDGLMNRNAVVRIYWEDESTSTTVEFSKKPMDEVHAIAALDDVEDLEAELDEENFDPMTGPTYSGSYIKKKSCGHLCIEILAPEEFYIESRVKRREDGLRGFRTKKTRADLIAEGYDEAKVEKSFGAERDNLTMDAEAIARYEDTSDVLSKGDDPIQPELDEVWLYTTYTKLALKRKGRKNTPTALYRIIHTENVMFEVDEVEEDEFEVFVPLRRSHNYYGNNFAKRVVSTQNARTALTRGILDHTAQTTNPRWQVLKGSLTNPREMLEERLGGLVNVTRQDGVKPFEYPNLNPFVFETLKLLMQSKEEDTGLTSLAQGLNKDAISNQNSQGLVQDLVTLSQVRQRVVARNLAQFLMRVYFKAFKLVLSNETPERFQEIALVPMPPDDGSWEFHRDVTTTVNVGYGDQERSAAKLVMTYEKLAADPSIATLFPIEKRHKLITDAMTANDVFNYADYLLQPEQAPPPQPDPMEAAKAEALKAQAAASGKSADAALIKAQTASQVAQLTAQLNEMKMELQSIKDAREADRKDLEVANAIDVAQREITLAEKVPDENQRGIFSPNS